MSEQGAKSLAVARTATGVRQAKHDESGPDPPSTARMGKHAQEMPATSKDPVAVVPPVEERVIGHNHIRRTPRDRAMDRMHMLQQAPRWQRRMRYRLVTSRRTRFTCLLFLACLGVLALFVLWFHGEPVAGIAVVAVTIGASVIGCFALEILIHCPKLTEGLLFHMGILERVWDEEDAYYAEQGEGEYDRHRRHRDRAVALPKDGSASATKTVGYTFAVSEDGTSHQARVEYCPPQEDYDYAAGDQVYFDPETGAYYDAEGVAYYCDDDEGGGGEFMEGQDYALDYEDGGEKPMWGDVAPHLHTIDAKLARVGERARQGAKRLMHSITRADEIAVHQELQDQALLAEIIQDEFPDLSGSDGSDSDPPPEQGSIRTRDDDDDDESDQECTTTTATAMRDRPAPLPVDEDIDKID